MSRELSFLIPAHVLMVWPTAIETRLVRLHFELEKQ